MKCSVLSTISVTSGCKTVAVLLLYSVPYCIYCTKSAAICFACIPPWTATRSLTLLFSSLVFWLPTTHRGWFLCGIVSAAWNLWEVGLVQAILPGSKLNGLFGSTPFYPWFYLMLFLCSYGDNGSQFLCLYCLSACWDMLSPLSTILWHPLFHQATLKVLASRGDRALMGTFYILFLICLLGWGTLFFWLSCLRCCAVGFSLQLG